MFKIIKERKIYVSLIATLAISFVIVFFAADAFAQKSGKGRYRKVRLAKDAEKDGFKMIQRERDAYFLQILGAEDPLTKKKLEGEKEVEYRCGTDDPIKRRVLRLFKGTSDPKLVECMLPVLVEIVLLEDPDGD